MIPMNPMDPKDDPKFIDWVTLVTPNPTAASAILTATAVPWNDILNVLLAIFQVLATLGCFGATRVTYKVRSALKLGSQVDTAAKLQKILSDAKGNK